MPASGHFVTVCFCTAHCLRAKKAPALYDCIRTRAVIPCYHLISQAAHTACLCKYDMYPDSITVVIRRSLLKPGKDRSQALSLHTACSVRSSRMYSETDSVCTSHLPVTFCTFHRRLLVPFKAFLKYSQSPAFCQGGFLCCFRPLPLYTKRLLISSNFSAVRSASSLRP